MLNIDKIEGLSDDVKIQLKKRNAVITKYTKRKSKKVRYIKPLFLTIYQGYDFLENFMLVRAYIQKRYDIPLKLLELLLFLAPKHFFTQYDYSLVAKDYTYRRISNLVKTGLFKVIANSPNRGKELYAVSSLGKSIITEFYECLSGEKKIPETQINPMALKSANKFEKKKFAMIKKMNQLPVSDTKKGVF